MPSKKPAPAPDLPYTVRFVVEGSSRTNERARHRRGSKKPFTPEKTKTARREIVQAYRAAKPPASVHAGPVRLRLTVSHATPPANLWPDRFCKLKPDLDNVLKLVADALNGIAYLDDAQIVSMVASKGFAPSSGIEVELCFDEEAPKPKDGTEKIGPWLWRLWNQGQHGGWIIKNTGRGGGYATSHQLAEPTDQVSFYASGYARTLVEAVALLRKHKAAVPPVLPNLCRVCLKRVADDNWNRENAMCEDCF